MNPANLGTIESKFGYDYKEVNNHEIRYQCPRCRDLGKSYEDYKLYVNTDTGAFWCHRCQYTGYISLNGTRSNSDIYLSKGYKELLATREEVTKVKYFELPKDRLYMNSNSLAYSYMISRGITDQDMRYYDMRYVPLLSDQFPKLQGRVIIPNLVIDFEYTDMYIARTYIGESMRYYNPFSSDKNNIVFNIHRIPDNTDRIIINEGVLNSIIAGKNSVAVYGKYVSYPQLEQILLKNPKEIVISLDRDAIDNSYKLASNIRKYNSNIKIKILKLPLGLDAVDLGRSKYLELIDNTDFYGNKIDYYINRFLGGI